MKFALLLLLLCTQALAASGLEKNLSLAYQERETNGDLVGAAIGVINPAEELALKFGEAASGKAFEIGSISKTFTGIALGLLSQQKKIDLTAPIKLYLPELEGSYTGNITCQQLATHTGKLIRTIPNKSTEGNLIEFFKNYVPSASFPEYQYSNAGFALLSLIVARASGQEFTHFIDENIFKLLRMKQSGFLSSPDIFQKLMTPYNLINEITVYDLMDDYSAGSGGIYSTLEDMMIFLRLNLNPEMIPELADAVRISQKYRLGWDHSPGQDLYWKNGGMPGFSSFMGIEPKKNTGSVVLNNTFNGKATQDLALIGMGYNYPVVKEVAPPAEFKKVYLGTYHLPGEDYTYQVVERNKGHLGIKVIKPDGNVDYVLKLASRDGVTFKLASAWSQSEDVIFSTEPESGRILMSVKSALRTDVYHQ